MKNDIRWAPELLHSDNRAMTARIHINNTMNFGEKAPIRRPAWRETKANGIVGPGWRWLAQKRPTIFLGVMLGRERLGLVRHGVGEAWNICWAIEPFLTTSALSLNARLKPLRANPLPVLSREAWGGRLASTKENGASAAQGAIVRMTKLAVHDVRPTTEMSRLAPRTWRNAREHFTAAWGCRPAVFIAACAVSAAHGLADRPRYFGREACA